ncbi:MAG: 2-phosphoglycerate kinase, partial [Gaiellaceae bacterium]
VDRLDELAVEILGCEEGGEAVRQLRRYRELRELDVPLIVLVGGGTGTGKSTLATEVAYRLGITRVTSTDFVRQTMRAFFARDFMPSIHYSSFEAGRGLPTEEQETGDPVLLGFLEQTRNVLVGVRASIERALEEGWSMVLEGVHLVPGMLPAIDGALVVQCVLEITDEVTHSSHFFIRDATSERRPVAKYLDHLRDIRRIQRYIVERARRTGVPVIENMDVERATSEAMELVVSAAERNREAV